MCVDNVRWHDMSRLVGASASRAVMFRSHADSLIAIPWLVSSLCTRCLIAKLNRLPALRILDPAGLLPSASFILPSFVQLSFMLYQLFLQPVFYVRTKRGKSLSFLRYSAWNLACFQVVMSTNLFFFLSCLVCLFERRCVFCTNYITQNWTWYYEWGIVDRQNGKALKKLRMFVWKTGRKHSVAQVPCTQLFWRFLFPSGWYLAICRISVVYFHLSHSLTFRISPYADHRGHAVWGMNSLLSLRHWGRGFEFH
jgi:hypothetical protein